MRHHQTGIGRHLLENLAHHWTRHSMGRHHHGSDGGHSRHGGFGNFGDGEGYTRGRKFTSDDLQLLLLALLAEKSAHGYELIKALEARSNGYYTPSPGMVYPALTYLEELGHVTVMLEGNRKCYVLAESGREYLAANQERADMMLARLTHIARKMDSVRRAFSGVEGAEPGEAGGWLPELVEARRALKNALLLSSNAGPEEQLRIADILRHATQSIIAK